MHTSPEQQTKETTDIWKGPTWQSNLVLGACLVCLGVSNTCTLTGTDSSEALTLVGCGLMFWGALQWLRRR